MENAGLEMTDRIAALENAVMHFLVLPFLPRDAMRKRGLCYRRVSVCLSVCLSRWWIVHNTRRGGENCAIFD